MTYTIWTDGACKGNPGPAGWAYMIKKGPFVVDKSSGHIPNGTNNVAELAACIWALSDFADETEIVLKTDSMYVINGITKWATGWKRRGWKKANGDPVSNVNQWQELLKHHKRLDIDWQHVKGHSGVQENEWCDKEAVRRCRN